MLFPRFRSACTRVHVVILLLFGFVCQSALASEDVRFPPKPHRSDWFTDLSKLISADDAAEINRVASALLSEEQVALYVVTIDSLASYNAGNYSIENYARRLFDHWGIGFSDRNYGILLLISTSDRKARIELGEDWGHEYDQDAKAIMDRMIIPAFKEGDFSHGIAEGVRGLDRMARDLELPPAPGKPWWAYPLAFIACLFGRGRGSGGGFGGGSSGGGGASGGW